MQTEEKHIEKRRDRQREKERKKEKWNNDNIHEHKAEKKRKKRCSDNVTISHILSCSLRETNDLDNLAKTKTIMTRNRICGCNLRKLLYCHMAVQTKKSEKKKVLLMMRRERGEQTSAGGVPASPYRRGRRAEAQGYAL